MSRRLLICYGLLLFLVVLLRTAWLSDHAYLALRTADNAAWGQGFRWNSAERAQVFDQPLWMLCLYLARVLTGEVYYGTLVLSIACASVAAWLVLREAATDEGIVLTALAIALSPSFITYSTSGLGTPLVHLIIAAFAVLAVRQPRRPYAMAVVAALAALTEPMTVFLTVPVMYGELSSRDVGSWGLSSFGPADPGGPPPRWTVTRGQSAAVLLALSPVFALLAWAVIAVYYYGSLVPMATLARLNQGITIGDRLHAGLLFAADAVRRDPILVATLVIGLALPFVRRTSDRVLAASALLYTAVVLATGGSTWSAYGLTIPFIVAVSIVARQPVLARWPAAAGAVAALVMFSAVTPVHTTGSHAQYGLGSPREPVGIIDPRQRDYQATGLLLVRRNQWFPDDPESARGVRTADERQPLASSPRPGFFGFAAGRGVHVIDATGLGDPLLARLPPHAPLAPAQSVLELRERMPPDGYIESLIASRNLIVNPALAAFYDRVRFVTRARPGEDGRAVDAVRLAFDADAGR